MNPISRPGSVRSLGRVAAPLPVDDIAVVDRDIAVDGETATVTVTLDVVIDGETDRIERALRDEWVGGVWLPSDAPDRLFS